MRDLPSIVIQMIEAREEESSRIGRVLHDEIGQLLTAAGLHLDAIRQDGNASPEERDRQLREVQQIFERVIEVVRELSHSLPPSIVDRVGLAFALERLVSRYRQRNEVTIRLMQDPRARVAVGTAQAMFRIAECALDNAVRHSRASLIEVLFRPTGRGIGLEVRDNGVSFNVDDEVEEPRGLGLLLMEHSSRRAGLQFSIESKPGEGTIVTVLDPGALIPPRRDELAQSDAHQDRNS